MGVDCKIFLPANIRGDDVAKVVGLVAGVKPEKRYFDERRNSGYYCHVPDVKFQVTTIPGIANIQLPCDQKLVDGETYHSVYYHFEYIHKGVNGRLLSPPSTAFWICVGKKLVDFFGGKVNYNDCKEEWDYCKPFKHWKKNCPEDGKEFNNLQNRMLSLMPITVAELKEAKKFAVYKK